ncbi:hypothetical protein ACVRXQ_06340 [Streptococcus panodentis]|uniref:YcxB-like protein domain-containing protein n=1 Tax=Streptococcus panodentis TaxID=1581472 RepID=A0ABS5AVD1_9STRE|nr:hypothetical protein [Streptococcus panodentis]MBP2620527.1 hypothetical protein [Streptococcus panodentis]
MIIKHSPLKQLFFIFIALWFGSFAVWSAVDYLISSNPHKDTSFFALSLLTAAFFLLLLILAIRRLTVQSTILSIGSSCICYHYSGLLSAKTYRIPLEQISHARYNQDSEASEISLWMEDGFDDFSVFNQPRYKIYAYADSRLISIVFNKKRLKELENQGLNELLNQYKYGYRPTEPAAKTQQPAVSSDSPEDTGGDSVFF